MDVVIQPPSTPVDVGVFAVTPSEVACHTIAALFHGSSPNTLLFSEAVLPTTPKVDPIKPDPTVHPLESTSVAVFAYMAGAVPN